MSIASTEKAAVACEMLAMGRRLPAVQAATDRHARVLLRPQDATLEDLERAADDVVEAARHCPNENGQWPLKDALLLRDRVQRLATLPPPNPEAERAMTDIYGVRETTDVGAEGDAVHRFRYGDKRGRDQARVELIHLVRNAPLYGPLRGLLIDLLKHGEVERPPIKPVQRVDQVALIAFAHGSDLSLNRCYSLADLLWPTTDNGAENIRKAYLSARKSRSEEIDELIERGKESPGWGERELRRLEGTPRKRGNPKKSGSARTPPARFPNNPPPTGK